MSERDRLEIDLDTEPNERLRLPPRVMRRSKGLRISGLSVSQRALSVFGYGLAAQNRRREPKMSEIQ
jgi:hypothetical protein